MSTATLNYRSVRDITADEFLDVLTSEPQTQHQLFVKLGGDPKDMKYAYLSYLTRELRDRGVDVKTSRRKGVWLP